MRKVIKTIDLWSMDYNDAFGLGMLVSAIMDGAEDGQVYDRIKVYKNSNIEYYEKNILINTYEHTVLFLKSDVPVRICFFGDIDFDRGLKMGFSTKCLPRDKSIHDLLIEGKVVIEATDLLQKTMLLKKEVFFASCDRKALLIEMLKGSDSGDGSSNKYKHLSNAMVFDKNFEMMIKGDLGDFKVDVAHKGNYIQRGSRWILLQKNGNF